MKDTCPHTLYPIADLHEDDGCVLLWRVPVNEPPILGWCTDDTIEEIEQGYYTHYSLLPIPKYVVAKGIHMGYEYFTGENLYGTNT